jgi:hypothetical protein
MHMLADSAEVVIGVDTHKDTHTAAVVAAATGQVLANLTVPATPDGYQQLLELADQHPGPRCGRSRAPAATAPGSPASSMRMRSGWWNWTGPSGPLAAMAPSPIR